MFRAHFSNLSSENTHQPSYISYCQPWIMHNWQAQDLFSKTKPLYINKMLFCCCFAPFSHVEWNGMRLPTGSDRRESTEEISALDNSFHVFLPVIFMILLMPKENCWNYLLQRWLNIDVIVYIWLSGFSSGKSVYMILGNTTTKSSTSEATSSFQNQVLLDWLMAHFRHNTELSFCNDLNTGHTTKYGLIKVGWIGIWSCGFKMVHKT